MKKTINFKEKLIKDYALFFYNKYFLARLYDEKYIKYFAELEIKNMENIYDYLVTDNKIQTMFLLSNIEEDSRAEIVSEVIADEEFEDFENQITALYNRIKNNDEKLKLYENIDTDELLGHIETIVHHASPYTNTTMIAKSLWGEFISSINSGDFDAVEELSKLASTFIIKAPFNNDDYKSDYQIIKKLNDQLSNRHPYNLRKIFDTKDGIEKKKSELNSEIIKSSQALEVISKIYLQMHGGNGMTS